MELSIQEQLKDLRVERGLALEQLVKFYGVTADCLPGLSEIKITQTPILQTYVCMKAWLNNSLLCELAVHPDFPRLMAGLEIYVNGIAAKQVQGANAIADAMSATIMKQIPAWMTRS